MKNETTIRAGTKVKIISSGEVGVVIHTWHGAEMHGTDCYVAFFGESFPVGKPEKIPYVLRYAATSLELLP